MLAIAPISVPPADPPCATISQPLQPCSVRYSSRRNAKRVQVLGQFAFAIPVPALLAAAAHRARWRNEAAIDKRQSIAAERGRNRNTVGAVAIE